MCGIVGYVGKREAVPVLMEGLAHLEYRGYDSAGIACLTGEGRLRVAKEKGKLAVLRASLRRRSLPGRVGIGHTRWATHGEPSEVNAHPHLDTLLNIALVHNGIIENHHLLKEELQRLGVRFRSQTDTEVIVNLIGYYYRRKKDFPAAFRKALKRLKGCFSLAVLSADLPDELWVFRRSNPLCVGLGKGENFVASDVTPLLGRTRRILYLEDEEMACVKKDGVSVFSLKSGKRVKRRPVRIQWSLEEAQKGGFPHFMLKEIFEQPGILQKIISERIAPRGDIHFDTIRSRVLKRLRGARRVFFVSCGTAYHAGLVGKQLFEDFLCLPSTAQVSSEFRYSDPVVTRRDLVVLITQSGETADTLAALREAKRKGAMTLAVVNVVGSTIAREADAVIYTHAGPEIGVASTKAYTAQLFTLALFAVYLAGARKVLPPSKRKKIAAQMKQLPEACRQALKLSGQTKRFAQKYYKFRNYLYLGRGYNFPTALEGALKLKEITYSHAHGYAAGEMKHGPIALIDDRQPVICLAPAARTYHKMISNIEEILARKGIVISIGTKGDARLKKMSDSFVGIPEVPEYLSPVLAAIPLQFFAYYVAVLNGRNVDQPRNLAKSVTVE